MKKKIIIFGISLILLIMNISHVIGFAKTTTRIIINDKSEIVTETTNYDQIVWLEEDKIFPSDASMLDRFGCSVSIDGEYALIGADHYWEVNGKVYVFKRNNEYEHWKQKEKLTVSDGEYQDHFGCSVSLDGDYALIGADQWWDGCGKAYVFKQNGSTWEQEAKLLAIDGEKGDCFGRNVALDGEYALIGAEYDNDKGPASGSVYVFKRDETKWEQQTKLIASDGESPDHFGNSVSLDDGHALIGAPYDFDNGEFSGSAYIFKLIENTWTQEIKLLPSDGKEHEGFGTSVSLDGNLALIGASHSSYIFRFDGNNWIEEAILPSGGYSVDLEGDIAIMSKGGGSVNTYKNVEGSWLKQPKVSSEIDNDRFGCSISLSGEFMIVGAWADEEDGGDRAGAAYVYKYLLNPPPEIPTISGPTSCRKNVEYTYTIVTTDPNHVSVYYLFNWGDNTENEWIGPYVSGEKVKVKHTWSENGTYSITAKAKDYYDHESDWSDPLTVNVSKSKQMNYPLLLAVLHRFPILQSLLKDYYDNTLLFSLIEF